MHVPGASKTERLYYCCFGNGVTVEVFLKLKYCIFTLHTQTTLKIRTCIQVHVQCT